MIRYIYLFLIGMLFASQVAAQSLTIGDNMPNLSYSKWIKGNPIKGFEKDRVYLFEFWATWCSPCIAAMPHLTALQKKHADKLTVVSVNVWEKTKGNPYETSLPNVEQFVNASNETMQFQVVADNNAQDFVNNWLKPAKINSIPATFIIKNGIINWIGHPSDIDNVLPSILEGNYDIKKAKNVYQEGTGKQNEEQQKIVDLFTSITTAYESGQVTKALDLIKTGRKDYKNLGIAFDLMEFKVLLNKSEKEAIIFADSLMANGDMYNLVIPAAIVERNNYSKDTYLKAIDYLTNKNAKSSANYDRIATAYANIGNFKAAATSMELAVEQAELELADEKYKGRVFESTLELYRKKVQDYKNEKL